MDAKKGTLLLSDANLIASHSMRLNTATSATESEAFLKAYKVAYEKALDEIMSRPDTEDLAHPDLTRLQVAKCVVLVRMRSFLASSNAEDRSKARKRLLELIDSDHQLFMYLVQEVCELRLVCSYTDAEKAQLFELIFELFELSSISPAAKVDVAGKLFLACDSPTVRDRAIKTLLMLARVENPPISEISHFAGKLLLSSNYPRETKALLLELSHLSNAAMNEVIEVARGALATGSTRAKEHAAHILFELSRSEQVPVGVRIRALVSALRGKRSVRDGAVAELLCLTGAGDAPILEVGTVVEVCSLLLKADKSYKNRFKSILLGLLQLKSAPLGAINVIDRIFLSGDDAAKARGIEVLVEDRKSVV